METLNALERDVLDKLLAGDHPSLMVLRRQLEASLVKERKFSGKGFFTELHVPEDAPPAPTSKSRVRFGDVIADVEGVEHGVGFLLFIDDGRLVMLEGYTFEGPWPEHAKLHRLAYTSKSRDLSELD